MAASGLAAALPGVYLLLTSTTTLIPGIWPYDAKRLLEFSLLLMLFLLPALNRRIRVELAGTLAGLPRWARLILLAVFGWGVLSAAVNARSPLQLANSLSEVALLGSLVLAVFVVAACRRIGGRSFDRIAIGLIALTGLTVGAQELLGVLAAHANGLDFNFRISLLHFSWPRFYNQVQSWTVPVVAALPLLFARYPLARVLCALVLALHWYVILATGARGSIVALSAALLFASLFLPAVRRPLLKWQLTGLALGALLYAAVVFSFEARAPVGPEPTAQNPRSADSGFYGNEGAGTSGFLAQSVGRPLLNPMGRTWMWRVTLQDASRHPLLGIGPMNYVCTSPVPIGHPHNFPLQLAAEWGIPVAVTVCVTFLLLVWRATLGLRRKPEAGREDAALAGLALTGVLAAALHACVSGVMVMPASQVAGILVAGLLLGLSQEAAQAARPARGGRTALALSIAGIALAVCLLALGAQEMRTMEQRAALLKPQDSMWPRMWQDARVCRQYSEAREVTN